MLTKIECGQSGPSWLVSNDTSYKQTNGINCGPVACMKIMEIYGFIEPGRITRVLEEEDDYRSVVMNYYSNVIQRFDSVLGCEMHGKVREKEIHAGSVDTGTRRKSPRNKAVQPATEVSPVAQKLSGVFGKEGRVDNMSWSIHQFIITGSGGLGLTIKKTDRACVVSGIDKKYLAFHHGIKVGNIILGSVGIDVEHKKLKQKAHKLEFLANLRDKSYFNELKVHPESMKEGTDIDNAIRTINPDLLEKLIQERMGNKPFLIEMIRHYQYRDQSDPWQHCDLHKFIIPAVRGKLGLEVEEAWRDTQTKYLKIKVNPNGMASFLGLRNDDILCVPGSDGELMSGSVKEVG
jgi:hypothetical protein